MKLLTDKKENLYKRLIGSVNKIYAYGYAGSIRNHAMNIKAFKDSKENIPAFYSKQKLSSSISGIVTNIGGFS